MNLTHLTIQPAPSEQRFDLAPAAEQQREDLLAYSSEFTVATTTAQANSLGEIARNIRTFVKSVRDMGMGLRRPLKAAQDRIKAIEDDYLAPLEQEQARLERIAGDWAASERRRVAAEEAARQAEIRRLEAIRLAAEQAAWAEAELVARENREAEERARAAEAKITNAKQLAAALKAEEARKAEAARQQAIADAEAEKARLANEAAQAAIRAPLPEQHKIGGMTTKREMCYEVTDLAALVKARPELCKIEAKPSAIRAVCVPKFLPSSDERDTTSVPGLTLWWADSTSTRRWAT